MRTTTYEEASKCPKCDQPMQKTHSTKGDNRSTIHVLRCDTKLCRWYGETKLVQVLSDNTVPVRDPGDKDFVPLTEGAKARARATIENVQEAEERGIREIRFY